MGICRGSVSGKVLRVGGVGGGLSVWQVGGRVGDGGDLEEW